MNKDLELRKSSLAIDDWMLVKYVRNTCNCYWTNVTHESIHMCIFLVMENDSKNGKLIYWKVLFWYACILG